MKRGICVSLILLAILTGCIPQKDAERKTITTENFSQYFDWNLTYQFEKSSDTNPQQADTLLNLDIIFWPKEIYSFSSVEVTYQINAPITEDTNGMNHLEANLLLHKNESTIQTYTKVVDGKHIQFTTDPTVEILFVSGELVIGRYNSQLLGAHSEVDKNVLTQKLELLQNNSQNYRVNIESKVDIYKRDSYNEVNAQKEKNHYTLDEQMKYVQVGKESIYPLDNNYIIDANHELYQTSEFMFLSYHNYVRDWLDLYFCTNALGNVIYEDDTYISTSIMTYQDLKSLKQWNNICSRLEITSSDYKDFLFTRTYHFTDEGVEVHLNANLQKNNSRYNRAVIDIVAYIDFLESRV